MSGTIILAIVWACIAIISRKLGECKAADQFLRCITREIDEIEHGASSDGVKCVKLEALNDLMQRIIDEG